jgi:hypothetical protein
MVATHNVNCDNNVFRHCSAFTLQLFKQYVPYMSRIYRKPDAAASLRRKNNKLLRAQPRDGENDAFPCGKRIFYFVELPYSSPSPGGLTAAIGIVSGGINACLFLKHSEHERATLYADGCSRLIMGLLT